MRKKKLTKKEELLKKGYKEAKDGLTTPYTKAADSVAYPYPLKIAFFNDAKKNIVIRTTPFTHKNNPELIRPYTQEYIYVQQGFLKLWDLGGYYQLLVE